MTIGRVALSRPRAAIAVALACCAGLASSLAVTTAGADVSHVGWPHTVVVWFGDTGQVGVGTGTTCSWAAQAPTRSTADRAMT